MAFGGILGWGEVIPVPYNDLMSVLNPRANDMVYQVHEVKMISAEAF